MRVWSTDTGECLHAMPRHKGQIRAVAVTADGRLALSGGEDRALRIWRLATAECLGILRGHAGSITAVAVTPDGRTAASGDTEGWLRVWTRLEVQLPAVPERGNPAVVALAVTPGAAQLVTSDADPALQSTLRLWDRGLSKATAVRGDPVGFVWTLALLADGQLAVGAVWDSPTADWVLHRHRRTTRTNVDQMAAVFGIGAEGTERRKYLHGALHLWSIQNRRHLGALTRRIHYVHSLACTPDGRAVLSWGLDSWHGSGT